jgi:uncharacterized membrane protein HdeD (DUF308 family)
VVAMQYQITDHAAIEFSRAFYESLADGLPVDTAVTEARVSVSMDSMLEWGTPVLYMRSPDGRLFDISTSGLRARPIRQTGGTQEEDPLRRYQQAVESAWAQGKLQANNVQRLRDLAHDELGLDRDTAADIEREVMGDTKVTILERQEEAAGQEERDRRLEELYIQARRLHSNRKWQAVIDTFVQIHAEAPNYPDPEGLLASSSDALKLEQRAAQTLLPALTGSWWAMALRGLVIVIIGLMIWVYNFRLYGGLMAFADGVVARIDAKTRADRRGPLLLQSRISFLIGLLVWLVWLIRDVLPHQNPLLLSLDEFFANHSVAPRLVGIWAIIIGSIRIFAAIQLRWETTNLWLVIISGASLAVFGFLLLPQPSEQYPQILLIPLALVSGIALIAVAWRVRNR